jgi:hypothetical protein
MYSRFFFRVDHNFDISRYLVHALVLYYSRQLAFLTTSTPSPIVRFLAPHTLKSSSFLLSILGTTSNHISLTYTKCLIKIKNQNWTCPSYNNTMTLSKTPHTSSHSQIHAHFKKLSVCSKVLVV